MVLAFVSRWGRRRLLVPSVAVMLLAGAGAALWQRFADVPPTPLPITIARLPIPHSGLLHIAQHNGYFERVGLDATVIDTATGHESIQATLDGRADVGASAETPLARAIAQGRALRVVATIFTSQWNSGIVARRDLGIDQPAALRGKRIGHVPGTATHYMLEVFLAFHRIPLDTVTLVALTPDAMGGALQAGRIDAAALWTPHLSRLQQALGSGGITFVPKDFYAETFNLVLRAERDIHGDEALRRLLRALSMAENFAREQPAQALSIVAKASGLPDTAPLQAQGDAAPLTFELTLQQSLLLAVENEIEWLIRRRMVQPAPSIDVLSAFDPEPLRAIKPAAVGIVK
jgi:ABC-type nitrate/sulfonate/bicarbonate transport system substrate-binding protein